MNNLSFIVCRLHTCHFQKGALAIADQVYSRFAFSKRAEHINVKKIILYNLRLKNISLQVEFPVASLLKKRRTKSLLQRQAKFMVPSFIMKTVAILVYNNILTLNSLQNGTIKSNNEAPARLPEDLP